MGAKETYNARIDFQEDLDQIFSEGAWVTVLVDSGGRLVPTGIEMTVGRVFCSNALETEVGWAYELFLDPRATEEQELYEYDQPFRCWITQLDEDDSDLFYQAMVESPEEEILVCRLVRNPKGERAVQRGQRDVVSRLREPELFPRGLERLE